MITELGWSYQDCMDTDLHDLVDILEVVKKKKRRKVISAEEHYNQAPSSL